jgi:hypothetical protein
MLPKTAASVSLDTAVSRASVWVMMSGFLHRATRQEVNTRPVLIGDIRRHPLAGLVRKSALDRQGDHMRVVTYQSEFLRTNSK